ncbi:hypothetical protein E1A91_D12G105400v1 [Gossypium mustelinum]|uniref:Uncharacterized protein n=1 Tax=Gossypium mustelinum TaxID=34275 RepID=A0A5D2SDY6_GOSMU|nr:hypothetical protein E1A91_D12G105400v1 [Gossypium mustelinum]
MCYPKCLVQDVISFYFLPSPMSEYLKMYKIGDKIISCWFVMPSLSRKSCLVAQSSILALSVSLSYAHTYVSMSLQIRILQTDITLLLTHAIYLDFYLCFLL